MKTIIQEIAKNCQWHKSVNDNYQAICEHNIFLLEQQLPSGSGIDAGCKIDIENSGTFKVIINFGFHHMNETGYYDGWTEHKLIVIPTFEHYDLRITGRNRNQVKDYLYQTFDWSLSEPASLPE